MDQFKKSLYQFMIESSEDDYLLDAAVLEPDNEVHEMIQAEITKRGLN
jgi:hypothetical protein